MMNKTFGFLLVFAQVASPAFAYRFDSNPKTWTDSDVESFLFLNQVQKQAGLNRNSNLCIDISEPVPGGKQQMRIISKIGDNKEGGLFVTGKSEIAKDGSAAEDVERIKKIVSMASGYQQAIMDYDESSGTPVAKGQAVAKDYMTAEVIGYTDGQGINGTVYGSLDGKGKSYTSNKQLGQQRAEYLSEQLGLSNSFAKVGKHSIESESSLKGKDFKEIRDCATWRTAEVKMTFQTGSKATDDGAWAMSTKMAPEKQRLIMQYEAAKQVQEALAAVNVSVLREEKSYPLQADAAPTPVPLAPYTEMSADYAAFCASAFSDMKYFDTEDLRDCKQTNARVCQFKCPKVGYVQINTGSDFTGGKFGLNVQVIEDKQNPSATGKLNVDPAKMKAFVESTAGTKAALKKLVEVREAAKIAQLKKSFPDCAKDPATFADLQTLAKQVEPNASACRAKSPNASVEAGDACAQSAILKTADGGLSGKLMRCVSMKRVVGALYSQGECRPGAEFSKVTFPHMNAHLGCKYCGNGWNAKDGVASFSERADHQVTHFHDQNTTLDRPTYQSLQSPSIHEIADCADCLCTNKADKLKKVFLVEEASKTKSVIDSINKSSCYCTPPVAPSCGVGPQGATAESKYSSLGQKYFYDACSGKFVAVTQSKNKTDQKGEQIANLVNQFNKGCAANPNDCPKVDMAKAISDVNGMLCETQKYKLPTDDPIRDCSKEDGVKAE